MKIEEALTFDDVMMIPAHSEVRSRKEPSTQTVIAGEILGIPIIASPMNTVCEHEMAQAMLDLGADGVLHRYMSVEDQVKQFSMIEGRKPWVAIGASGDFVERASALYKMGVRKFCVDIANGHSSVCLEAVESIRSCFGSEVSIMAGNVCTGDGARRLEDAGADAIRVGIGPGSMCTTRLVTGFGVPQVTAIQWCASSVSNAAIIADGGIRSSGDIAKALAFGADAVMIGGLLAGTDETPGETFRDEETGNLYKYYHGMASEEGRAEWFSKEATSFVPEGASTKVSHKGEAKKIVKDLNNSLKVSMSFANAKTLMEFRANSKFVRITDNGRREANPNRKLHR